MFCLLNNSYDSLKEGLLLDPIWEGHPNRCRTEFPANIHPEHAVCPSFFFLEILDVENLCLAVMITVNEANIVRLSQPHKMGK